MDSFHRGEGLKNALVAIGKVDDLQSPTKALPQLAKFVREFISSSPFPRFNVVCRDEVVIARLQHCWGRGGGGGKGVAYSSDAIRYCSPNTLSAYLRVV